MLDLTGKEEKYLEIEVLYESKTIQFDKLVRWMRGCNRQNKRMAFIHNRYQSKKDFL